MPGKKLIYTRSLSELESKPLPHTEAPGTWGLGFSDDGRSIAFLRGNELFKVPVEGGIPSPIAPPKWQNAIWAADYADDGSIFVAPAWSGLYRIAPDGKAIDRIVDLVAENKEVSFDHPRTLPVSHPMPD